MTNSKVIKSVFIDRLKKAVTTLLSKRNSHLMFPLRNNKTRYKLGKWKTKKKKTNNVGFCSKDDTSNMICDGKMGMR